MTRVALGGTGLQVYPLALGTNVFGWTASEPEGVRALDAYVAAGGQPDRHRRLLLGVRPRAAGRRVRDDHRALAGLARGARRPWSS